MLWSSTIGNLSVSRCSFFHKFSTYIEGPWDQFPLTAWGHGGILNPEASHITQMTQETVTQQEERERVQHFVSRDSARRLRVGAAARGVTQADLLDELLRTCL